MVIVDAEGLMPKKMEEIAYQSSDKIYGKEDTGPYECLRFVHVYSYRMMIGCSDFNKGSFDSFTCFKGKTILPSSLLTLYQMTIG